MSDPRPPLAAFDDDSFETVADETTLDAGALRDVTERHQESVRELPGVDDIVYEWRNHFHMDPLVYRTDRVYVLALPAHVWDEFGDRLDLGDDDLAALKSVHDRQARRMVPDGDRFEADEAVVLGRP
jgi:hypothetical protein